MINRLEDNLHINPYESPRSLEPVVNAEAIDENGNVIEPFWDYLRIMNIIGLATAGILGMCFCYKVIYPYFKHLNFP